MPSVTHLIKVTFTLNDLFEMTRAGFEEYDHARLLRFLTSIYPDGLTIPVAFTLAEGNSTVH